MIGYAINCLPIEIFPGIRIIFGSVASILAAVKFGPLAGGVSGFVAGLRMSSLEAQPFPLGACLYALEGVWVGYRTKKYKRRVLTATLSYWLFLGSWLSLAIQLFLDRLPLQLALILQARSIINGMLAGILVESGIMVYEILRRQRSRNTSQPARLSLSALITLATTALISLPLLYISTSSIQSVREKMLSDLTASSSRDVAAVEAEVRTLMNGYERGLDLAGTLLSSPNHMTRDNARIAELLSGIREQFSDFQAMYVTDSDGRILAFDPPSEPGSPSLTAMKLNALSRARDLLAANPSLYASANSELNPMTGPAVVLGKPLADKRGNATGFVFAAVRIDKFHAIVSRYKEEGEALVIADREGTLIAESSRTLGDYKKAENLEGQKDFEIASQADAGTRSYSVKDASAKAGHSAPDSTYLVQYATLSETGWRIWERQSLSPVKAKLSGLCLNHLIVLTLAMILAFIFGKAVARLSIRPMVRLEQSASRLNSGNLSERRPAMRLITTEYDSLFRCFDEMAERLQTSWNRQQELLKDISIANSELEATFDAMTDAVIITDTEDRILRANRAYYRLSGLEAEQISRQPLTDIAHPDDDWHLCEACVTRRAGQHAIIIEKPEENVLGRDLEIRVDPIYNVTGERVGSVEVLRDLTEKRIAEAEAEKASALLRNLVDAAYDAVYATDLYGRFLWANKRAADLLGLDSQNLEGVSFLRSIHEEDFHRVRLIFQRVARGNAERYEARYLTGDYRVRNLLVTSSPVYTDKEVVAVLCIIRDVTEERLEVEQVMREDKLRALGQLASGVAHNFNNSLTAVLGYTQMVLSRVSDTKIARHLKTVETAALDAAKMVQRIQNFARQRKDEPSAPSDLNQIVRDALDLTRSRWRDDARAAGIVYDIAFKPTSDVTAMCDQSAMREVFVNIIINALDAMPSGGRLTIATGIKGDMATIKFADTGCGMTEDVRLRIFEPFYTTKGAKGYGMGLAVTYGIIERHGGEIQVTSQPGYGSTFIFKLPLARVQEDLESEIALESASCEASVLIVDDEPAIRALLSDILRARGHKVLVAEDGLAGLRTIESMRFDMLITDLSMPGADGWTIASKARSKWPDIKLVIVTGYGEFAEMAVPGGDKSLIDALISKPFNIAEIDTTISKLLAQAECGL